MAPNPLGVDAPISDRFLFFRCVTNEYDTITNYVRVLRNRTWLIGIVCFSFSNRGFFGVEGCAPNFPDGRTRIFQFPEHNNVRSNVTFPYRWRPSSNFFDNGLHSLDFGHAIQINWSNVIFSAILSIFFFIVQVNH